nr:YfhO family protein [Pyrinomonadaceae bacterium]
FAGYVGLLTLALAAIALCAKRDGRTKFWGAVAVVAFALAVGRYWPLGLYRIVYYVPLLNLFRVPARHLMELDFALAVLAGRGITSLHASRHKVRVKFVALAAGACVFVLAVVSVKWLRPAGFQLGREAPVSLLRAPELFMPVMAAVVSLWALWRAARGRRGAIPLLVLLLWLDLALWGQASGWRRSPAADGALAQVSPAARFVREKNDQRAWESRILSVVDPFYERTSLAAASLDTEGFIETLQPNASMLRGIHNAAGSDGFGLARYSALADDMELWGTLRNPARSLNEGREFDLLNVRYLVVPRPRMDVPPPLPATEVFGDRFFSAQALNAPTLANNSDAKSLHFVVPRVRAREIALVTRLSYSVEAPDGEVIARVRVWAEEKGTGERRALEFPLRAGVDTAEWAHDRPDIVNKIRHKLAPVAFSWEVKNEDGAYQGHNYITAFSFPESEIVTGGEIEFVPTAQTPNLSLEVMNVSFVDQSTGATVPLRREWLVKKGTKQPELSETKPERWQRAGNFGTATIYENKRALPRAWLATRARGETDEAKLKIIRTGKFADGALWDARRTVLTDELTFVNSTPAVTEGAAEILTYEPNRITLRSVSSATSVLVISENFYPGWSATVDGRRTEVLRVNYNLRGVELPPGEHRVELVYRPKSVLLGLALSLAALMLLLIWQAGYFSKLKAKLEAKTMYVKNSATKVL